MRECKHCGRPIQSRNVTGYCATTPECDRLRRQEHYRLFLMKCPPQRHRCQTCGMVMARKSKYDQCQSNPRCRSVYESLRQDRAANRSLRALRIDAPPELPPPPATEFDDLVDQIRSLLAIADGPLTVREMALAVDGPIYEVASAVEVILNDE